jgi:hypothetical protein
MFIYSKNWLICFLSILFVVQAKSQDSSATNNIGYESITTPNPKIVENTHYMLDNGVWQKADSSLHNFHRYNPAEKFDMMHIFLSNLGQAEYALDNVLKGNVGYRHGFYAFDLYYFTPQNLKYFKTTTPYTSLYYMVGGKAEQIIDAVHAQNIKKNSSIAFNIRRYFSDGTLQRNSSQVQNVSLNNYTISKNKKYSLLVAYIYNKTRNQENGGAAIEDIFLDPIYKSRKDAIPIKLEEATNEQKSNNITLQHYVNISQKMSIHIYSNFNSQKNKYSDNEQTQQYYQNIYLDSNATNDTYNTKYVLQKIALCSTPQNPKDSSVNIADKAWNAGIGYLFAKHQNFDIENSYNDFYLYGKYGSNPYSKSYLRYSIDGQIHLSPKYLGDLSFRGNVFYNPLENFELRNELQILIQSPSAKEEEYLGNHYQWQNNFKKSSSIELKQEYQLPKWQMKFGIDYIFSKNKIYYDTIALPMQYEKGWQYIHLNIEKDFDFKNFYLGTQIHLQHNNNKDLFPMPLCYVNTQFYYKGRYIKGLLNAQLGIDFFYYTPFMGYDYMPATASFFVQQKEIIKPQPRIDFFFNIQIKRAKVFFKYQYINDGLPKRGYYIAPDYISQSRAFKLGAKWDFFD